MKITKIANIAGGQDGAVHGGFLFRFDEKSKCHVYETKKLLCAADMTLSYLPVRAVFLLS